MTVTWQVNAMSATKLLEEPVMHMIGALLVTRIMHKTFSLVDT